MIVEDHLMFREVLRKVCVDDLHHTVVAEADDGRRAVEAVNQTNPDLVLLDLHLPNLDGFGVVEAIRRAAPLVRVLILSSHCDEYTVFRAERARVQGFVDKNTNSVAMLKSAIGAVAQGGTWFSEAYRNQRTTRVRDPQSFDKLLTPRERDVLALVGAPLSDTEISRQLEIAEETVEKHRFNILKKLGLNTTTELVRYARDHGFTLTAPEGDDALLP